MKVIKNPAVAAVFDAYPPGIRSRLLRLRALIYQTAAEIEGVGELEETLKWGEPAYLTAKSGSGTTIRIHRRKACADQYALYVHCQTNLIDTFRSRFPDILQFEGNRAIVFLLQDELPIEPLRACIAMALTYHQKKRANDPQRSPAEQSQR